MQAKKINTYKITDNDSIKLNGAFLGLPNPYRNFKEFRREATKLSGFFPDELYYKIKDFGEGESTKSHLIIKSSVKDAFLPVTPQSGDVPKNKKTFVSEGFVTLISTMLGEVIAYYGENNGSLIQQVVPILGLKNLESNNGSKIALRPHCENVFSTQFFPHFLILHCIRGSAGAETMWFEVNDLLRETPAKIQSVLRKPIFKFPVPNSFGGVIPALKNIKFSNPSPILIGNEKSPEMRIDFTGMVATEREGEEAIAFLQQLVDSEKINYSVQLQTGDTLILNNRLTAHGRKSYQPDFDNESELRWLQRVFIHKDPWLGRNGKTDSYHVFKPVIA